MHGVHGWVRLGHASDKDAKQDRRRWTLSMFQWGCKLEGGELLSENGDKKPPPTRLFMTMIW